MVLINKISDSLLIISAKNKKNAEKYINNHYPDMKIVDIVTLIKSKNNYGEYKIFLEKRY